jgi:anti-sigma factor RsiW
MTRTVDEQLSALFDGELPVEQQELLLRRLEREPELRARLSRYGLIGAALTNGDASRDAMRIADRVRDELAGTAAAPPRARPGVAIASGWLGAGLAAAAALLLVLNLNPVPDPGAAPVVAGIAPTAVVSRPPEVQRASLAPERMRRYVVAHSGYANSASRQFVDSHVVMPAFRRAAWQSVGPAR